MSFCIWIDEAIERGRRGFRVNPPHPRRLRSINQSNGEANGEESFNLFTPPYGSLALQRLDPDARRHLATTGGGRSRRRARGRQPARAQAAALSGEGQTCDLHLPARRLFTRRLLRLQTETDRRREERPFVSGQTQTRHAALGVQAARQERRLCE